jgi:beta-lactam-binding protein with PASTA domain
MKLKDLLQELTLRSVLIHVGLAVGTLMLVGLVFFYIYLPNSTNHNDEVPTPDLIGVPLLSLDSVLGPLELRYEIGDSTYSASHPPFTVLQQFPKPGHPVKRGRKIYLSINRSSPPTLPIPNLLESGSGSLANAEAVLRSNELRRGRILYQHSPFKDLIIEMRMNGRVIEPGDRVPKGSVIDLVVGDGSGPKDFIMGNLVGLAYDNALLRLANLSLHLGSVKIPDDVDTTDIVTYVLKQLPMPGDSVSVGDPIELWIGPKDYKIKEEESDHERENK